MKIAFITSRFPFPVEKGDKLRAYHHLRWLGTRHEVHVFALTHHAVPEEHIHAIEALCAGVHVYRITPMRLAYNLISGWLNALPAQVAFFLDAGQKRKMQRDLVRFAPQHILAQLIRTSEYVRALPLPKTLDYMDVFSVGAAQRIASASWLLRPFYLLESKRLRQYEREVYADFDHHTIISMQDRDRLPLPYQGNVTVLSNGVDLDYFSPDRDVQQKYAVLFVGNMGYLPNIEATEYLVRRIMPKVWQKYPGARVCLAGARPHRRVLRLRSSRVTVTGWVEDVRPFYATSKVFVAPMFSGMGQQNKILEAMAMGVPCITTDLVDKAIGAAEHGAIVLAGDSNRFSIEICRLLDHPAEAQALSGKARAFVVERFDWDVQNKALERLLTQRMAYRASETLEV